MTLTYDPPIQPPVAVPVQPPPPAGVVPVSVAARAVAATKVYCSGAAEVRALDGVDAEFAIGRFTAIMGPSGSGKSTLMHLGA